MAHNYKWELSTSINVFFSRLMVSCLDKVRQKALDYDQKHQLTYTDKAETLVIEWSGANDLITVNKEPSLLAVDKAIAARINNIKKMIEHGYYNFLLFNLPNLALTPRFKAKSQQEADRAQWCCEYFNKRLQSACNNLYQDYPFCSIRVFDINTKFKDVYEHPENYHLDKNKQTIPYTSSDDFDNAKDGISKSTGYTYYDDVHPTADVHAILGDFCYAKLLKEYQFLEPNKANLFPHVSESILLSCFRKHYEQKLGEDRQRFFGNKSSGIDFKHANLKTILHHALVERGQRTIRILNKLGWVDKNGHVMLPSLALEKALPAVRIEEVAASQSISLMR